MEVTPVAVLVTVAVVAAVGFLMVRLGRRNEPPSPEEAARAAPPAKTSRPGVSVAHEGYPLVQLLVDHASEQAGIRVADDPVARRRVEEAAMQARLELDASGKATVSLPFLAADQSGPKHFNARLRRMPDGTVALED